MFYTKLLAALPAAQMSSLQPSQQESRQAPSEKDRSAAAVNISLSVYCNITISKAHWNSSICHLQVDNS